jgi:hypothetical protein
MTDNQRREYIMRRYQIGWAFVMLMGAITGYAPRRLCGGNTPGTAGLPAKILSQSIIFDDELLAAPQGQSISIASKRYQSFKTVNLGQCYAEEDIVADLKSAKLNVHYLFQGTVFIRRLVFQSESGLLCGRAEIYPVVNVADQMQDAFSGQSPAKPLSPGSDAVIKRVQQDLISFARMNNLQISQLFDPAYTNQSAVQNVISAGIAAVEQQYNTTARKLLADFMTDIFQSEFSTPAEPNIPAEKPLAAAETPNPAPLPASGTATVETPPPSAAAPANEADRSAALRQRAALMLKPGIRPRHPPPRQRRLRRQPRRSSRAPRNKQSNPPRGLFCLHELVTEEPARMSPRPSQRPHVRYAPVCRSCTRPIPPQAGHITS